MPTAPKTTVIPDDARRPADRLPKAAVAEATGTSPDPVTITVLGEEFEVAPDFFDNLETAEMLEDGRIIAMFRLLLGAEGYGRLKARLQEENDGRATLSALAETLETIMAQVGPTDRP